MDPTLTVFLIFQPNFEYTAGTAVSNCIQRNHLFRLFDFLMRGGSSIDKRIVARAAVTNQRWIDSCQYFPTSSQPICSLLAPNKRSKKCSGGKTWISEICYCCAYKTSSTTVFYVFSSKSVFLRFSFSLKTMPMMSILKKSTW